MNTAQIIVAAISAAAELAEQVVAAWTADRNISAEEAKGRALQAMAGAKAQAAALAEEALEQIRNG